MAQELIGLDKWVKDRLTEDVTILSTVGRRVFEGFAPDLDPETQEQPAYPLVVFSVLSSPDIRGVGGVRVATRPTLLVKAIGEGGGYGPLQEIADAIDALLQDAPREIVTFGFQSYEIGGCQRMNPVQYAEAPLPGGIRYNHLGGVYRVFIRAV